MARLQDPAVPRVAVLLAGIVYHAIPAEDDDVWAESLNDEERDLYTAYATAIVSLVREVRVES